MKILHILDHSLPLHSGYTFRSQNLFRAQRSMGYHPVILTSPKHEENWQGEVSTKESINSFTYYRTGRTRQLPGPVTSEAWLMYALSRRILEVAKVEKPAIIHAHSPVLNGIPALWAARKLRLPMVYEIRAFWEDAAVDHATTREGSLRYNLTKKIETMVCRRADHIGILCNGLKNDLISRGISPNKITPIFNGVNRDDFRPCPPDEEYLRAWDLQSKKVVGFIGSFYRYEGLDLLVKAFAETAQGCSEAVLLLVGGGETEAELRRLVKDSGLAGRVIMPGRIPHERIPGVYAMIDVLAYPRYSMRLTELVTPLKPLEAMAMGKALVASDVGGHKELIINGKTGLLFKAGDKAELVASLQILLNNSSRAEYLQQEGRRWVEGNRTWDQTASVYRDIYTKACGTGLA